MSSIVVVSGASELLTFAGGDGPLVGADLAEAGLVENGALIAEDGVITWVGSTGDVAAALGGRSADTHVDASGCVVTPAYVDCHTHVPFAGGREREFEMRIEGKTYLEIAAAGGGINSSVRHFREMSTDDLLALNRDRLLRMAASGTGTVECKTGYGLSLEHELRALEIIDRLSRTTPLRLVPTFLGAHSFPPEHRESPERYVALLVDEMIPAVAEQGIARFCDIFIEKGVFDVAQARRVLDAARSAGLGLKLHVDEFTALGGSELAAELCAVSADHLEAVTPEAMSALAAAGVVGVLMPGVNYFLGSREYAPARRLIDAGVPVALATDFNPGSCMCHSMEMVLSLACTQLRMRPIEALAAATRNAAFACGLGDRIGRLRPGFAADVAVHAVASHRTLAYWFGSGHVRDLLIGGRTQRRLPAASSHPDTTDA